ncbi:YncE family protein [Actinoplanes subglobosus]|uniref:YncE family protein n=1 Tax=Actinoplanes subglobosus TaxID=1547892 RepID=A0ABV8J6C0_9ACTN
MRETATAIGTGRAVDLALREAGGGRMAGVRIAYEFGRQVHLVQFVRGTWLCTASVDAATGEVTGILDDGLRVPETPPPAHPGRAVTARITCRTVRDITMDFDDRATAWVATDAGVGVVRLRRDIGWTLTVQDHHTPGFGEVRHLAAVPGGVVAATAGGRVFRIDTVGRLCWSMPLPGTASGLAVDGPGERVLVATGAGAVELDARTGRFRDILGTTARVVAYHSRGERVVATHRGSVSVTGTDGVVAWVWEQGERPERMWARDGRVYLAGEGGLKEIVPGEGVVARWSSPGTAAAGHAVIAGAGVFTCSDGTMDRHDYATAAYHGPVRGLPSCPDAAAEIEGEHRPWLLTGHRDGLLTARPL